MRGTDRIVARKRVFLPIRGPTIRHHHQVETSRWLYELHYPNAVARWKQDFTMHR